MNFANEERINLKAGFSHTTEELTKMLRALKLSAMADALQASSTDPESS